MNISRAPVRTAIMKITIIHVHVKVCATVCWLDSSPSLYAGIVDANVKSEAINRVTRASNVNEFFIFSPLNMMMAGIRFKQPWKSLIFF